MARGSVDMNFLFTLAELQRLVRAYADKQAARYGITRAQWAVLAKVERTEGLKQSELAEQMEMQPITLTRLIDRLCDNGWIERRGDDTDRRVNRLYLRKAARPLLGKLARAAFRADGDRARGHQSRRRPPSACSIGNHQGKRAQRDTECVGGSRQGRSSSMADPVLKFPPDQKGSPSPNPRTKIAAEPRRRLMAGMRRYRRVLLLVVLPLVALIAGLTFYLNGGRYVTTDDAYVGAQKVLITPDVSGKIISVAVKEGQQVSTGDILFQIDPVPFQLALAQARAKLEDAKTSHDNLVANVKLYEQTIDLVNAGIALKQRDVDRKILAGQEQCRLAARPRQQRHRAGHRAGPVATGQAAEIDRPQSIARRSRSAAGTVSGLQQAKAARDDAQRNLDLTTVRAPMNGVATQVDQIQLGRFVMAGTPVFSVIDTSKPWVDANPKESDFTYVAVGQPVTVEVDAFPNHLFKGTVGSLSPGTGAQFAILPPQNATGNFVKVVQRVPVRIYFDSNDKYVRKLKAGMSAYTTIDTGHRRSLAALLGFSPAVAAKED